MLAIIGYIIIIVVAYYAFKTAKDTGRNGFLWAFVAIFVGIGMQLLLPVFIAVVLGFLYIASGTPLNKLQDEMGDVVIFLKIGALALNMIAMWLILRHLSKLPEDEPFIAPPPPPTFDQPQ